MDKSLSSAYNASVVFQFLTCKVTLPCIIEKNARIKKKNHFLRNLSVMAQINQFNRRKDSNRSYEKRRIAETRFSSMKELVVFVFDVLYLKIW